MIKRLFALVIAGVGFASIGHASTVSCASLTAATASYDTFTSCTVDGGGAAGQDRFATVDAIVASLFGDEGYDILAAQSFAPQNGGGGSEFPASGTGTDFSASQVGTTNSYLFSMLPANTLFVSIKASNGFELFRVPAGGVPFTLVRNVTNGVSHFSTFGGTSPIPPVAPVPLPAGGLLLLAGLGGFMAMRRRARA